jgi:hypothetical protein
MSLIPKGTVAINQAGDVITFTDTTGVYNGSTNPTGYGTPNRGNANHITDFIITKPDASQTTVRNNEALTTPTQAAVPVLVPANALTKTFTPSLAGYDTSYLTFPDGVYKFSYRMWYRVVGTVTTTGLVSGSGKVITFADSTFTDNVLGFGDTRWVKVLNAAGEENDRYVSTITSNTEIILSQALDNVSDGDTVTIYAGYYTDIYLMVTNGLLRCIQPKMAKYSLGEQSCCKQCGSPSINKAMEVFFGIFSVEAQFTVGLYAEANANISALNKICSSEDCKC